MNINIPKDDHGRTLMTKKYLQTICENEDQFSNPIYNNKLYLNSKGFSKIENLDEYTEIEGLWLQSNFISKIENLNKLTKLRFLYLQNNAISTISGLENLTELIRLDLSYNRILKIEGLSKLIKLKELSIACNLLSNFDSILELKYLINSLTFLNLSENQIPFDENMLDFLAQFYLLTSLELQGNPLTNQAKFYRKQFIVNLSQIKYLDNKEIPENERRFAAAFIKGGQQGEDEERKKYELEQRLKSAEKWESEKDYYKKVDERMKKAVAHMRIECREEKLKLIERKEELSKSMIF